jgi:cystathionine gamma-lyase
LTGPAGPSTSDDRRAGPSYRDGTRSVHAGLPPAETGAPLLPGPVFAAPFHLGGPAGNVGGEPPPGLDHYGREGNPTWRRYEQALAELEGGEVVLFSSGMAAITALLLPILRPGDAVVIPADGYFTGRAVGTHLAERGVTVREVPTARPLSEKDVDGARLVLVETPSNPGLDLCDIAAAADLAHAHGALLAVDNTTATPLGQRPLDLGADFVVSSDTKALSGHSDLLLGHVTAADPERAAALRHWRTSTGSIAGPFEAWLAHRSLATLDLRLARQAENALALVDLLAGRPEVAGLRYPGWARDPAHALALRQMRRFGGVLSFRLASSAAAARFLTTARLVYAATSFGGLHTTADRRAQWGGDAVGPGFLRLSTGCEDPADLVADVETALHGLPPA